MGDGRADEMASLPPRTTKKYVHRWPRWWDDIERPDVPFPKYSSLRGDVPSAPEILRDAEQIARRGSGDGVGGSCAHADISEQS